MVAMPLAESTGNLFRAVLAIYYETAHYPFHVIRELYVVAAHMHAAFILPLSQITAIYVMTTHITVAAYLATDCTLTLSYHLGYP